MSLEVLKTQRGTIKSKVTRFRNFVDNEINHNKFDEIRIRLSKFELLDKEFEDIQRKIEKLHANDNDLLAAEEIERETFENEFYRLLAFSEKLLSPINPGSNKTNASNHSSTHATESASIVKQLPKISIPKFDGDLSKWIKFRDSFNSLINEQIGLSKIDKFNYLSDALEGEAARAIESLGISEVNYDHAWKRLTERYEDPEELIEHHTKSLCEITQMSKGSYVHLRRIIDDATNHLAALENLGEATTKCDSLLIYIIGKKLDEETRKLWSKCRMSRGKRTFQEFLLMLEQHCKYLQKTAVTREIVTVNSKSSYKSFKKPQERIAAHAVSAVTCACDGNHPLYACEAFRALQIPARIKQVRKVGACLNCLRLGHRARECTSGPCRRCKKSHNTLLHLEIASSAEQKATVDKEDHSTVLTAINQSHVLLGTAIVEIEDRDGNVHECRALLDSGSQIHFATQRLCNKLKASKVATATTVTGIHRETINLQEKTQLKIRSKITGFKTTITCLITSKITEDMPNIRINRRNIKIPKGIQLADPEFDQSKPIDLLIGAALFWDLLCVGYIKGTNSQPNYQKTKLGWIVTGAIKLHQNQSQSASCHVVTNADLHMQVEKFWKTEDCKSNHGTPLLDKMDPCENHFISTTVRDSTGRFIVSLPLKENKHQLGESYEIAFKRLCAMEKKFEKCYKLKINYQNFMQEYEQLQHMTLITQQEVNKQETTYYLPHHAVFKEQSTTTKLRVVFDGSAKTTSGLSLNDIQYAGYEVQDELFCILVRFRKHKYIITADVEKMYRQILVREQDRCYQQILWRRDSSQQVQTYKLNTVTYGTRSGAFLAKRCLRQLGEEVRETKPDISKIILNDFYVDDLLTGADTIYQARKLCSDLEAVLKTGCFELRKWASNECSIVNHDNKGEIIIDKDPKTLGLIWTPKTDQLSIAVTPTTTRSITKRTILSQIAQIFDPLGLVAPVTVKAKIILQRVWQLQLEWDESLPQDLHTIWQELQHQLQDLNLLRVPRRAVVEACQRLELHGFCDASETAFGACVYLRGTDQHNIHTVHLLCAKSKVAPLRRISLPRLELCAALLLAQLAYKVTRALDVTIDGQYFWSDSMIAIAWIKSPSRRWKTFVANRTAEIQRLTNNNWSHVTSENNPADLASRGVNPCVLLNSQLWWQGPLWLSQDESAWPQQKMKITELQEEMLPQAVTLAASAEWDLVSKFSSWSRLTRIIAYCQLFIDNARCKKKAEKPISTTFSLSTHQIQQAESCIVKMAQQQAFRTDLEDLKKLGRVSKHSKLNSLAPFIDAQGLIRVGGRLQNAQVEYSQKHPVILPSKHRITILIIEYEHRRLLHAGCQAVISSLRTKYWPISVKTATKQVIKRCLICTRQKGVTVKYIMGNLPSTRVSPTRPFYICGVDYAGPLHLKDKGRGRITYKSYICIFVCFATKAVHIELAQDLSTEAFLNCLRRLISRRGRCQSIYSDNGLNFVGAKNKLNELGCLLTNKNFKKDIGAYALKERISWHMNPPYAPHFGGLWESAVKSAKFHLKRVIGETRLAFEEMYTILTQIEACLNSRPLSSLSSDPNDLIPLTPGHFLVGEALMALPEADVREVPMNRLDRYQHLQYMVQHFWHRWQREYLHGLQQRNKWTRDTKNNIQVGTMVLIKEDNLPPTRWRLGRIIEAKPGSDNIVRVVKVKTGDGVIVRAVTKLVRLPIDLQQDNEHKTSDNP